MRVSENRVLKTIFGPTRWEVVGCWRKLHCEGFLICTCHQEFRAIKSRMRWAVPVVHMEKRNACRVLFGKP